MRSAFFDVLTQKAEKNKDIYLLTGDLGFKLFDSFRASSPQNFIDMGIAEQNMVGVAAGLSLCGKDVYCYSIIPFLVMRAFEQIRVDIAFHSLSVKLIGVGGGISYGLEGFTHFALEDFALMNALPNMTIVAPADPAESACLANLARGHEGPLYVRLGKNGDPSIHEQRPELTIGKAMILSEGKDLAIFAVGNMVHLTLQVAELLKRDGISTTVINMHTIKPLDRDTIHNIALTHSAVFTVEEHYLSGGLGSAVSEVLLESSYDGIFRKFGIAKLIEDQIGDADYLRRLYGLDPETIRKAIMTDLKGTKKWNGKFALLTR